MNIRTLKSKRLFEKSLYIQYADKMMSLCFRYIGNLQDAEEVLHNGFIKVFNNMNKLKNENSLGNWIRSIMINECLMHIRRRTNFKNVSLDKLKQIESDENIYSKLESEDYYKLINELAIGYRTIFNLYAIEGFKHKEIAEMLNISESTSRSQLTKARKELRRKLKTGEFSYG